MNKNPALVSFTSEFAKKCCILTSARALDLPFNAMFLLWCCCCCDVAAAMRTWRFNNFRSAWDLIEKTKCSTVGGKETYWNDAEISGIWQQHKLWTKQMLSNQRELRVLLLLLPFHSFLSFFFLFINYRLINKMLNAVLTAQGTRACGRGCPAAVSQRWGSSRRSW